jgi:hypothetical protein
VEADLVAIREATLAIDAGDPHPRRRRALALADLGLITLAREDAILWSRDHPVDDTSWTQSIGRRVPSRTRLGPADASTWAAAARPLPSRRPARPDGAPCRRARRRRVRHRRRSLPR